MKQRLKGPKNPEASKGTFTHCPMLLNRGLEPAILVTQSVREDAPLNIEFAFPNTYKETADGLEHNYLPTALFDLQSPSKAWFWFERWAFERSWYHLDGRCVLNISFLSFSGLKKKKVFSLCLVPGGHLYLRSYFRDLQSSLARFLHVEGCPAVGSCWGFNSIHSSLNQFWSFLFVFHTFLPCSTISFLLNNSFMPRFSFFSSSGMRFSLKRMEWFQRDFPNHQQTIS